MRKVCSRGGADVTSGRGETADCVEELGLTLALMIWP
jgi:hypothetical protein